MSNMVCTFWVKFLWLIKMFQIHSCCVYQSFLLLNSKYSIVWPHHDLPIFFIITWLNCFHFFSNTNKAVVNICFSSLCEHIFSFIFGCYLGAEWQDYRVSCIFRFMRIYQNFLHDVCRTLHFKQQVVRILVG